MTHTTRTLVLEIGCEELPSSFVDSAIAQLPKLLTEELARHRVVHGEIHAYGTARRLAAIVRDVREQIDNQREELLGPAESSARDAAGAWTKAAEGFARKNAVSLDALRIVETPKGRYLQAERMLEGGPSDAKLGEVFASVCARLTFEKSMRWSDVTTAFGRPIQWLLGLFGGAIVPFEFVSLASGRETQGHRFLSEGTLSLDHADRYVSLLRDHHVLVDPEERRRVQGEALQNAAMSLGGTLVENDFLEGEVLGLVEWPFAIVGEFDHAYLALPEELIETVMCFHQRYFAVRDAKGAMLPNFITTANTALDPARIRKGNERVMRARLNDAKFFVEKDRAETLASRRDRLAGIVYHQKLGSYADKVLRIEALAAPCAAVFGADATAVAQAAGLAKCDLVALTVGEFPELQGYVGRDLARNDGLDAQVCEAIAEHYRPATADAAVAATRVGAALAIADRLDTLAGFFAIGQRPSGGGDPFGLRRAALGVLRTLLHHGVRASIRALIETALGHFVGDKFASLDRAKVRDELVQFIRERLEVALAQRFKIDMVRACLETFADDCDPVDIVARVEALDSLRENASLSQAAVCIERATNITKDVFVSENSVSLRRWVSEHVFALAEEQALQRVVLDVEATVAGAVAESDYKRAVRAIAEGLTDPLETFFTKVFVMDEDVGLRDARLRLLKLVAVTSASLCRFELLSASKQ